MACRCDFHCTTAFFHLQRIYVHAVPLISYLFCHLYLFRRCSTVFLAGDRAAYSVTFRFLCSYVAIVVRVHLPAYCR
jgi:hypothetical protein